MLEPNDIEEAFDCGILAGAYRSASRPNYSAHSLVGRVAAPVRARCASGAACRPIA